MQVLKRITLHIDNKNQLSMLASRNPILLGYDLVAACPGNEKLFHTCLEDANIDIISLDFAQRIPFPFRNKTISLGIQNGIQFEIQYSAALKGTSILQAFTNEYSSLLDQSARRNMITNALNLVRATKGRNIILTSAAQKALDLRGPYDITNLYDILILELKCRSYEHSATLFALQPAMAKDCVTKNCRSALKHAGTPFFISVCATDATRGAKIDAIGGWGPINFFYGSVGVLEDPYTARNARDTAKQEEKATVELQIVLGSESYLTIETSSV